jgi:hypothetical protein
MNIPGTNFDTMRLTDQKGGTGVTSSAGQVSEHAVTLTIPRMILTDEYSVHSRRGLCVKTGQLRVELIALKVV